MKRLLILMLSMCLARFASAITIYDETPASTVTVKASTTCSPTQAVQHLVDGSGVSGGLHDTADGAETMWHTILKPTRTCAAVGLPASPAWVKFDFAAPRVIDEIRIWNLNQSGLTQRGFCNTHIFGTADGENWFPLHDVVLTRASGAPGQAAQRITLAAGKKVKSVVICAVNNYGADCYGLSKVRFLTRRAVAEADLPVPTGMMCAPQPFYRYRSDGKAGREIAVTVHGAKLYTPVTFDVDCAGVKETTTIPVDGSGAEHFSLILPASVTNACEAKLVLRVGKAMLQQTVKVPAMRRWEVYVLMHSHVDIGYTHIQLEIEKKQARNITRAIELIRETKNYPPDAQFKWNAEVFWPVDQFYKTATPEQKKEFEQDVRDGYIGIDAMYANLLTGICRGEELLRQFSFATDFGRRCGVKVDSMMISDVPGLTWGVVPSLSQAGVKYISDGPNYIDRIGWARVTWEDNPFWWIGPNGTDKVLYWSSYFGYAYGSTLDRITDAVRRDIKQLEAKGYPYDITHIRWSKGDNGSADERVMQEVHDWNAKYAYPKLIIATTSEMFHKFEKRYGDKIPTYRGDFTPYWEDGVGSSARETGMNRHNADRLLQAESLWAMLNPGKFPAAEFAEAWKNTAMYSEHTWGAHNSVREPDLDFVKTQWKYKQAYALNADKQSHKLLTAVLPSGDAQTIDVFNTTSWRRTGLVTLSVNTKGDMVKDNTDKLIPSQRLSTGELVFLASEVPPFGAKRFTVSTGRSATGNAKATVGTLSTPQITVRLDPATGAITSLRQTGLNAELVDGKLNHYIYLPGANIKDAKSNGPVKITVKEHGPLVASLMIQSDAPGCRKLLREVRVVDGLDHVELIDRVDKLPVRAVEGVHFGFEFNVPDATVRMNSPLAVVETEKDQLPGACKNWFSIERWVDVANAQYGVTWTTADAPLVEMGGLTANLLRTQPDPNAYMKTINPSSKLYSWVMNNHWHTNYRADQEGWTTFRYAVRPHRGYDPIAAAHFGIENTIPLIAAPAIGAKPMASVLQVEPAGVLVSEFKPSNDGKAWIIRLLGASGKDETAQLTLPGSPTIAYSDMSEMPGKRAPAQIPVPSWSIVTLRVDRS